MRNQRGFIQIPVLIAIIAGVLVLVGIGSVGVQKYENYQIEKLEKEDKVRALAEVQRKFLEQANTEIEKLKQESAASKEKQNQLEQAVKKSSTQPQSTNLATLIKGWRPRIAYVVCSWGSGDNIIEAQGSGLLVSTWIATNDHVLRYGGKKVNPTGCLISFPDRGVTYHAAVGNSIAYGGGIDFAGIHLSDKDAYIYELSGKNINYCKRKAEIGESIVILGYPYTGSKNDITATEGIISGYDYYYYVTSAKIEHGNSGGAAILVKDNCYLGIPSSVAAGELESLGRILDARIITDAHYFENHPNGI